MIDEDVRAFEYDIALSFAGEDRAIVQELAELLKGLGIRVFYDDWEKADLWGKDLYRHLDEVYRKKARFCLVFVSANYIRKAWTSYELRVAQARAFRESSEYILPIRLDDSEVTGITETTGYIDLRRTDKRQLAELVAKKVGLPELPDAGAPVLLKVADPGFRIPRIARASLNKPQAAYELITKIAETLDARLQVLRNAGLEVNKETGPSGLTKYQIKHRDRLVYFVRMQVGSTLNPEGVSFLDGWNAGVSDNAETAVGDVRQALDQPAPVVHLTNFSLIADRGVSPVLSFQELAEAIWEKACTVIESIMNQRR